MKDTSLERMKIFWLLAAADLAFILLHILHQDGGAFSSSLYSLTRDRGYAEFFEYTKEFWIALLLFVFGAKQRSAIYALLGCLFVYFLMDDALRFHEQLGALLANVLRLAPALGLRAVDWGELLVAAVIGLIFGILFILFYLLSRPEERRNSFYLAILIGGLAFFGVPLDMAEIAINQDWFKEVTSILEEGGEMLAMSAITWYVFHLPQGFGQDFLESLVRKLPGMKERLEIISTSSH